MLAASSLQFSSYTFSQCQLISDH